MSKRYELIKDICISVSNGDNDAFSDLVNDKNMIIDLIDLVDWDMIEFNHKNNTPADDIEIIARKAKANPSSHLIDQLHQRLTPRTVLMILLENKKMASMIEKGDVGERAEVKRLRIENAEKDMEIRRLLKLVDDSK